MTVGPDAKALGLNEAVTAELLGASNIYTNPANLALEETSTLNATYTLWIGDLTHTHAAVNLRKGSRALAFGFLGSQVDGIPRRTQPGPSDGSFNVSSLSLSAAYANTIGPVAVGATLQYLREEYYIYNASGYAANIGLSTQLWNDRILLGATVLNLGEMNELRDQSTALPTTFRAGFDAELVTFTPPENDDLPVTVNLKNDWVLPLQSTGGTTQSDPTNEHLQQYCRSNLISPIPSCFAPATRPVDTVRHWSAGAGIKVGSITANYALVPFETGFGTAHSIGLRYRF
ncbi:MAG: hypothetical protein U5J63_02690 [Fodinibius sp.]|nr:hypothetical protein [Fodinibius sp.]